MIFNGMGVKDAQKLEQGVCFLKPTIITIKHDEQLSKCSLTPIESETWVQGDRALMQCVVLRNRRTSRAIVCVTIINVP